MRHEDVFNWLETIDIYTQPSRQEGLPRALIEAMSRGLPAFGARTAGIPELLEKEFIFSNTKYNIDEICSILVGFSKEKMLSQSIYNFNEAKKVQKRVLLIIEGRFFLRNLKKQKKVLLIWNYN